MNHKISKNLSLHRLEQAEEDLEVAKLLYEKKYYKSSNNRAYYAIFHSMRAVLALEAIDFKKHKDVQAYFNKNYVNKEIFPKKMGRRIAEASKAREDSDYDDEFSANAEDTLLQIQTAEELIKLVKKYIEKNK